MQNPNVNKKEPNVTMTNPNLNMEKSPQNSPKKLKKGSTPVYEKELSLFEHTTMEKIKDFREARASWITEREENSKIHSDDTEGVKDSHLYTGRCAWIRRLGLKNSLLREHHHSVRPLKYWTLRRKLPEYEDEDEKDFDTSDDLKAEKREKFQDPCGEVSLWSRQEYEECERLASRLKGRKARKLKKQECRDKKAKGPCKKALRRLKDSKLAEGILESCKCDAGREVTVVIKGFCLCDQTALNKIDLTKVCGEYAKKELQKLGGLEPFQTTANASHSPIRTENDRGSANTPRPSEKKDLKNKKPPLENKEPLSENKEHSTQYTEATSQYKTPFSEGPKYIEEVEVKTKSSEQSDETEEQKELYPSDSVELLKKRVVYNYRDEALNYEVTQEEDSKEELKKEACEEDGKEELKEACEEDSETEFKPKRRVTFKDNANLKADGEEKRGTPSNLTLFKKLLSEYTALGPSDAESRTQKGSKQVVREVVEEFENMSPTDSLRTLLDSKKLTNKMPETDSMNNLLLLRKDETKVNFKKSNKKKELEDNEDEIKIDGAAKKKLSNLAFSRLPRFTNSIEIHKKHLSKKSVALELESVKISSLLDNLIKGEANVPKKNEKEGLKVKLNPVPKVIAVNEEVYKEKRDENKMSEDGESQASSEKTIPAYIKEIQEKKTRFEKTQKGPIIEDITSLPPAKPLYITRPQSGDKIAQVAPEPEKEGKKPKEPNEGKAPEPQQEREANNTIDEIEGKKKLNRSIPEAKNAEILGPQSEGEKSDRLWVHISDELNPNKAEEDRSSQKSDKASLITLFKNKSCEKSEFGLTKEELKLLESKTE